VKLVEQQELGAMNALDAMENNLELDVYTKAGVLDLIRVTRESVKTATKIVLEDIENGKEED